MELFDTLPDGRAVHRVRIGNRDLTADILTLGATLHRLEVDGVNVVLGHPDAGGYLRCLYYAGATCGRVANRIGGGRFTLDGLTHRLATNEGGTTLHGGPDAFDTRLWSVEETGGDHVVLSLTSPDGDQGFPGTLAVTATYTVFHDELRVEYRATTDAPTVVNLTTHPYFNLDGEDAGSVDEHLLQVFAETYTAVDEAKIPTGELPEVGLHDLRDPRPIAEVAPLDHNFVIDSVPDADGFRLHAVLHSPASGRALHVHSDAPGFQVYTGDSLDLAEPGTSGNRYRPRAGVALEAQGFPDAPNHPDFPSIVLRPGETYRARTRWAFHRR